MNTNDEHDNLGHDLHDLARSIEPDSAFVAKLGEQLQAEQAKTAAPRRKNQTATFGRKNSMIGVLQPFRESSLRGLTVLAAALLVTVLGGLFLMSQPSLVVQNATPTPELPLPVGGWVSDFSEASLQKMRDMGMTWISASLFYNGDEVFAALDTAQIMITSAHDAGFKILLQVRGEPGDIMQNREQYNTLLATLLGDVALLNPDAIQVWTEPNIDRNWLRGEIIPASYVTMLMQAYTAIKSANPDVMVITAAPAPTSAQSSFPEQIMNDDLYYDQMADAGAAEYADCIGVSYVQGVVPPDATSGDPRDNVGTRYLTTMLARAHEPFRESGLPLCVTDLGYASTEGVSDFVLEPFQWAKDTTAAQQAEWTAGAISVLAEQTDIPVAMAMIWRINPYVVPEGDVDNVDYAAYFSLIRPDGSCPACVTIGELRR